jgi:hypothetical protein
MTGDGTLMSIATGGVHRALALPSIAPPFIVFIHQSGMDKVLFQGIRGYTSMLFQVKAVGPAKSVQALADASARLDVVITRASEIAVTGGAVKACFREQPFQLDELVNGEMWTSIGGLYRLIARSS